jgi:predicted dehydrogenase
MDRRHFIQSSTAMAGVHALSHVAHAAYLNAPRRVALIGCGWYGKADLLRLIQVEPVEVVGLCDVDSQMLAEAAAIVSQRQKSGKKPPCFADYRKMLSETSPEIVLIATPDHWHALTAIDAIKAGAHLYLQKPISVDVVEGQAILAAARKYNRMVQVGTQRRSTPHLIDAKKEIVESGRLGKIGMVEIYCYYHMRARETPPDSAPPSHLDYEMWTGPAPLRPYNPLVHPRRWRAFMEYGNGIVGDMCIHMLDMVRWMLGLGWPTRISSEGGIIVQKSGKANISDTQTATFQFGDLPVIWQHRSWGHPPDPKYPWGATLYGENGTLKCSVNSWDFTPLGKGEAIHRDVVFEFEKYPEDRTEKDLERHVAPAIRGHMQDLLNAIDNKSKPVADIEQGHISTASCILANIAMDLGRSLAWDSSTQQIPGDIEANKRLVRTYRNPWVHPDPTMI